MFPNPIPSSSRLHRRAALGAAGAIAATLSLGRATAQEATPALATHPLAGVWLAWSPPPPSMNLAGLNPAIFSPDGTVLLEWAVSYVDPGMPDVEVAFNTPGVGTWEPIDDRKAHFLVVAVLSDAKGTLLGSVTIEGHPLVSDDGQSFTDNEPEGRLTVRNVANEIVAEQADFAANVTATRMSPTSVVFPAVEAAATPTH